MTTTVDLDEICKLHAEALFVSDLQPSSRPGTRLVRDVVVKQVFDRGENGIAAMVAEEYGEHPEAACQRMVWAIEVTRDAYALDAA